MRSKDCIHTKFWCTIVVTVVRVVVGSPHCDLTSSTNISLHTIHSNLTGHAALEVSWEAPRSIALNPSLSEVSALIAVCLFPLGNLPEPTPRPTMQPSLSPTKLPTTLAPSKSPTVTVVLPPTKEPELACPNSLTNTVNCFNPGSSFGPLECYALGCCYDPLNSNGPRCYPRTAYYTPSPTSHSPTRTPTSSPVTSSPTDSPTFNPTFSPTTVSPTTSPTVSPTFSPTTVSPTTSPTVSPTFSPTTVSPTTSPTISPPFSPTTSPTKSPSLSPTDSPSLGARRLEPQTDDPLSLPLLDGIVGYCLPLTRLQLNHIDHVVGPSSTSLDISQFAGMAAGDYTARAELVWSTSTSNSQCVEKATALNNVTLCTTGTLPATVDLGDACPDAQLVRAEHCHDETRMNSPCKLCTVDEGDCPVNHTRVLLEIHNGYEHVCLRTSEECQHRWSILTLDPFAPEQSSLSTLEECGNFTTASSSYVVPLTDCISPCKPGYEWQTSRQRCEPLVGSTRCTEGFVFDYKDTCMVWDSELPVANAGKDAKVDAALSGVVIPRIQVGQENNVVSSQLATQWWISASWKLESFYPQNLPKGGENYAMHWVYSPSTPIQPDIETPTSLTTWVDCYFPGQYVFRLTVQDSYSDTISTDTVTVTVSPVAISAEPSGLVSLTSLKEQSNVYTLQVSQSLLSHVLAYGQASNTTSWIEVHYVPLENRGTQSITHSNTSPTGNPASTLTWTMLLEHPQGVNVMVANSVEQIGELVPRVAVAVVVQDWSKKGLGQVWQAVIGTEMTPSGNVETGATASTPYQYQSGDWSDCLNGARNRDVSCVNSSGDKVPWAMCVVSQSAARTPATTSNCNNDDDQVYTTHGSYPSWAIKANPLPFTCAVVRKLQELVLKDPCLDRYACIDKLNGIEFPPSRCNSTELASHCGGTNALACPYTVDDRKFVWYLGSWYGDESKCESGDQSLVRSVTCLEVTAGFGNAVEVEEALCPTPKPIDTRLRTCESALEGVPRIQWVAAEEKLLSTCEDGWCGLAIAKQTPQTFTCVDMTTGNHVSETQCQDKFGDNEGWEQYEEDWCGAGSNIDKYNPDSLICPLLHSANISWVEIVADSVLDCPSRIVASTDGRCCSSTSSVLDRWGDCCELGQLDACGECVASGRVPDMTDFTKCCETLDASGRCCSLPLTVDECGVCGGTGLTCAVIVETKTVFVGSARRLSQPTPTHARSHDSSRALAEISLGEFLVAFDETAESKTLEMQVLEYIPDSLQPYVRGVRWSGGSTVAIWGVVTTDIDEQKIGWPSHTILSQVVERFGGAQERRGVCGNGLCELGELCVDGQESHGCCRDDCPIRSRQCPVSGPSLECGGHGVCQRSTGTCMCWSTQGYAGPSCNKCRRGWVKLQRQDGSVLCVESQNKPVLIASESLVALDGSIPESDDTGNTKFGTQWWPLLVSIALILATIVLLLPITRNMYYRIEYKLSQCWKRTTVRVSTKVVSSNLPSKDGDDDNLISIPRVHFESSGIVLPELMQEDDGTEKPTSLNEPGQEKTAPSFESNSRGAVGQQGWVKLRPQGTLGGKSEKELNGVLWETYYFVLFPREQQLVFYTNVSETGRGKAFLGETGSISLDKLCFVKSLRKKRYKGKAFQIGVYLEVHEQRFDAHGHRFETTDSVKVMTHDFVARTSEERQQWVDALSFHIDTSGIFKVHQKDATVVVA